MIDLEQKRAAVPSQARELAASIDAAADDLERNGPVSAGEVHRALLSLYAELAAADTAAE